MLNAELTAQHLAGLVGVDVESVSRWIAEDRVPHPITRLRVARTLNQQETYLWPSILGADEVPSQGDCELEHIWRARSAVSTEVCPRCSAVRPGSATSWFTLGPFLLETLDITDILKIKSSMRTHVRVIIGDPDSDAVRLRGAEEQTCWLPERCRTAQLQLLQLRCAAGIEIKVHGTTLYASLFRFDDIMLVNPHAYGAPRYASPVQKVHRRPVSGMFDHYAAPSTGSGPHRIRDRDKYGEAAGSAADSFSMDGRLAVCIDRARGSRSGLTLMVGNVTVLSS